MATEVGSQYRFSFTVKDDTGTPVNPATKTVTVTLPDQTTATPSVVADSTGTFHADYTFAQEGLHKFVAATTGPVTSKTDYAAANVFRSVIGIDETRNYIGETDTTKDAVLRQVMAALTDKAESIAGTCVQRRIVDERVTGSLRQVLRLGRAPLPTDTAVESVTSVFPGGPSWVTADLIVYPDSGTLELASQLPFWWGPWKVTYTAGRLVVPERIQLAVKEMVFDFWASQRSYGPGDLEPGMDDTARWETALAQYEIPPHAKSLLEIEAQPGFA